MNLLDRAKRLIQGQSSTVSVKTQYYNVTCPEGHRMSGARHEGYQALRCPTCGEGVFILPRSPLPDVPAPKPASPQRRPVPQPETIPDEPIALSDPPPFPTDETTGDEVEIDWEEEVKPKPAPPTVEPRRPPSRAETSPPGRRPAAKPRPRPAPEPVVETVPFDLRDWARRRRNPLVFAGVLVVVAGTLVISYWRSKIRDYPRQAEMGRTLGLQALDEGRFDVAHRLLSDAKRAVNALGGKVEGAEEIRHGADEAAIYANLCPDTLEAMLEEADPDESSGWPRRFANLYKSKGYVIDATVVAAPGEDGAGAYDLDYRILPKGEWSGRRAPRVGRIDLARFRLIEDLQPKVGTHLVFGARLASFTLDFQRDEWLVGLEPESGVVLLHQKAVAAVLMSDDGSGEEGGP